VQALRSEDPRVLTSASESLISHLLAFAAEDARLNGRVIGLDEYWSRVGV
jgi:hypothetical protein